MLGFVFISLGACSTIRKGIHVGWERDAEICHAPYPEKDFKSGPPAHASAHGYRSKHIEVIFFQLKFDNFAGEPIL